MKKAFAISSGVSPHTSRKIRRHRVGMEKSSPVQRRRRWRKNRGSWCPALENEKAGVAVSWLHRRIKAGQPPSFWTVSELLGQTCLRNPTWSKQRQPERFGQKDRS